MNTWLLFKNVLLFKTSVVVRAMNSPPDVTASLKHNTDFKMPKKHYSVLSLKCYADFINL